MLNSFKLAQFNSPPLQISKPVHGLVIAGNRTSGGMRLIQKRDLKPETLAGSLVKEEQTPINNVQSRPKTPPLDNSENFQDSNMFETIPSKAEIEKLDIDQLKQLESEIAIQMEHIQVQMNLLKKQLDILGNCAEIVGNVLHDKLKDIDIASCLESNGSTIFSPIESNYIDTDAPHGTNEREVPPGVELIPLAARHKKA